MKPSASKEEIVLKIESIIKETKGKASPQDIVASTGYALHEVMDAMARLLELYISRVTMDSSSGKLIFQFEYPLNKRGSKNFKEILYSVTNFLWKIFTYIYKASIGVILILYTIIFVLILIALSKGNDNDRGIDLGDVIGGVLRGIIEAFYWNAVFSPYSWNYDEYGNRYRNIQKDKNKGKGFIKSVFSFVFGPERPPTDPLNDIKEAAAFIRKNNGRISAGQIIALSGVDYFEAESRLAEYVAKFAGELIITNEGTIVAEFNDFLHRGSELHQDGVIEFYEDEIEAPYELTGNSSGTNFAISTMNSFNLIMSLVIINFFSQAYYVDPLSKDTTAQTLSMVHDSLNGLTFVLGYFPLIFSALFFIIPIFRKFGINKKNTTRQKNIIRKKIIGYIKMTDGFVSMNDILKIPSFLNFSKQEIEDVLNKLVVDLRGKIDIDSNGSARFDFTKYINDLRY